MQKQTSNRPESRLDRGEFAARAGRGLLFFLLLFFLLPLVLFWPVTLGDRTLLPVDNLFAFEPYRADAKSFGIEQPRNLLLSDLILQNYAWRRHIADSLGEGQLPLWNPYLFSGTPFLAKGQHLGFYPLSIIFFVFPLWKAYGVFTVLHLGLAGLFAYTFARTLRMSPFAALVAGLTYELSGFMLARCVFPMIIASAAWLPLILAALESLVARREPEEKRSPLPWLLIGAAALGCQVLAGHIEITCYTLLTCAFYATWRILQHRQRPLAEKKRAASWVAALLGLGLLLGAVQLVPLAEVLQDSFRQDGASLAQVRSWAYPWRQAIAFLLPNFFGNPSHHGYFDLFSGNIVQLDHSTSWGVKNFVEGSAYLGLLPLLLAFTGIWRWWKNRSGAADNNSSPAVFIVMGLLSISFIFGTPFYALIYGLPGMSQVHSPFRWAMVLTLSATVLAGYGARFFERLPAESGGPKIEGWFRKRFLLNDSNPTAGTAASFAFWAGVGILVVLGLSRVFFSFLEPLFESIYQRFGKASEVFPNLQGFYSYEFRWALELGLLLAACGLVLRFSRSSIRLPRWLGAGRLAPVALVALLSADLLRFASGFYPNNDPSLLDYRPPAVEFLKQDASLWRLTTYDPKGLKTFQANAGWLYDLQDIRGYDSIFSDRYRDYMNAIGRQDEQPYNRIAPIREGMALDSPLLDLLNVKYVLTEETMLSHRYRQVFRHHATRIYQNLEAAPRAFTLPYSSTVVSGDVFESLKTYDPRFHVILEAGQAPPDLPEYAAPGALSPARVTSYRLNEVTVEAEVPGRSWLILADSYEPGWKAYAVRQDDNAPPERELELYRANGIVRAVLLEPGRWKVRFEYMPRGLKPGAALTLVSTLALCAMALWAYGRKDKGGHQRETPI